MQKRYPLYSHKQTFCSASAMSARGNSGNYARYSITSSATDSSVGGTVRPNALAVFALMISWNLLENVQIQPH